MEGFQAEEKEMSQTRCEDPAWYRPLTQHGCGGGVGKQTGGVGKQTGGSEFKLASTIEQGHVIFVSKRKQKNRQ